MNGMTNELTFDEADFFVKQQGVYLEKSIRAEQFAPCYTACLWHEDWRGQTLREMYSAERMAEIDVFRKRLSKEFGRNGGVLEVHFFDLDLLSLLFRGCSEEEAQEFCGRLALEYQVRFCGRFPSECYAPVQLFSHWYSAASRRASAGDRYVSTGVSYRQRYLIGVVCRDRQEEREQLLLEAADQAIRAHHAVLE